MSAAASRAPVGLYSLKRTKNRMQTEMIELEKQNQDLVEKLDALKAIETSINQ